ncbi:hypothetical protein ATANTOWER_027357 [Ataeniobius toweri]|uniref:Uncharacterized protein n=1 Tax=Ataeniobius toweri TaxID=208326 RepID=A0ABU7CDA4_9TELE|nr:hypothetical protein [Ataeniobius toweri]
MASACESDEETYSGSESEASDDLDSEQQSDSEDEFQAYTKQPCKYYNRGGCKDGARCSYLHVCKYFLTGSCRYGSSCKLNHSVGGRRSAGASGRTEDQYAASNPQLTDGRPYQWQINDGKGWKDVGNDHIIEAQYSLPHSKSIKIYNTPYGAVNIDFSRMRVYGKNLRVRRLDDGNTMWFWYCTLNRKWMKYGDKDSKGNQGPVKSSDIERKFQSDPKSSFTFTSGGETFEIKFPEMQQVGKKKKRKVTRRPSFRLQQAGIGATQLTLPLQRISLGSKPQWKFEGDRGAWHDFKHRSGTATECSVTSDEIERKYQQNPTDCMMFKVKGQSYKLDFRAMTQINEKTKRTRRIKRVLLKSIRTMSGNHYEWQLLTGNQWLKIDNDHVIETHYCQPGAKGITINTSLGKVFIDFDELQTDNAALRVQRLSFLPQGQTEDTGWYFRDDSLWCEYGSQSSSMSSSSISSKDIETHFTQNPQGVLQFSVGSTRYSLDFSTMTQTNLTTGLHRNVRRRPKFTLSDASITSISSMPLTSQSNLYNHSFKWEFMGDEGQWTEYQTHICSLDNTAIENQYQQNPQGQVQFIINKFSYILDFAKMCQVNQNIGTKRSVRRSPVYGAQSSSLGTNVCWQFQDIDGRWKDYSKGYGQCSISSLDIELQYQQNTSGTMIFTTSRFSYELNLSAMTQQNLSTNTTRSVRRLLQ